MTTPQEELDAFKKVNNSIGMSQFFNHPDLSIAHSAIASVKAIALGEKDHATRQTLLVRCMETMRHPDVEMRRTAVEIAGAMYEEKFVRACIPAMIEAGNKFQLMERGLGTGSNQLSETMFQYAKGLEADLKDSPAYAPLTLMLLDADATVRQAATSALSKIKPPQKKWSIFGKKR